MTIEEFMRAELAKPFIWGETDCAATADRWVKHCTGRSPCAASEQGYGSEDEATALLWARALPLRLARAMRLAGFRSTRQPQDGDLAAISFGPRVTCALRCAGRWVFRDQGGLSAIEQPRILMAWGVV